MGVITQGILGGFSGKVGPIVGGRWKQTDYMRGYKIPSNPNSSAQQVQRAKISKVISVAKSILGSVIQPYWNPFNSRISGFNRFVQVNASLFTSPNYYLTTSHKMAEGTLEGFSNLLATYNTSTGVVSATWTDNTGVNNALGTDIPYFVAFKLDGTFLGVYNGASGSKTRASASANITLASGLTATDLILYGFFYRGTVPNMYVSNSSADVMSA